MKNKLFEQEVSFIKNPKIKNFLELAIDNLPDYFWHIPASSSGKYHPQYALGDGGLARHTIAAANIAYNLLQLEQYQNIYSTDEQDCIIAAILLHDGFKQGNGKSNTGYTTKDHAIICSEWVISDPIFEPLGMKEDRIVIGELIRTHMGQWDEKNKPTTHIQQFVHLCDYLASRKYLNYDFENRVTTTTSTVQTVPQPEQDPKTLTFTFGKHSGKLITEVAKNDKGYVTWAIENLKNLDEKFLNALKESIK